MCWTYGNLHIKEECSNEGKMSKSKFTFSSDKECEHYEVEVMTLNIIVYCIQKIIPTNLSTYTTTNHGLFDWKTK
jgi:hypothetical protein